MVIHPQARTTPKLRAEIKAQRDRKQVDLAKQYNVTPQTIRKWQNRDEFTDKSHRPHRLQTKLSEHQEMLVVELRKLLLLPLDDLLVIVREFIHPEATRSGIHRTLRRHGVSHLNALLRAENEEEAQPAKRKTFKDYAPGFVHVDVKYLPQMADESRRTYLFVAIDRATRWVYLEILPDKSARSAKGFLKQLIKKAPFIITRVLTDNGKEFTDRFIANGERKPTGQHPFDQVCQAEGIEHRLIKPKHPQTNGMVERFNGRISEILATTHFDASRDLQETLYQYQKIYNYHVPQKNIGHITPIQALKDWHKKQPELFKKKIYDLSGLDNYQPKCNGQGKICSAEALVRMHDEEGSVVYPGEFIPVLEETGDIIAAGDHIIRKIFEFVNKHNNDIKRSGLKSISINVSPTQYSAEGFVDRVITFAKQFDIEPRSIIFEITEDVVPSSIDNVVDVMHRLTQYGFRFSIDDFGTGYSSLRYLKNLPLGELKIDKSFVDDVTAEGRAAAIVKTIIDMAHNFNLDVVAEGVESEEQLNILAKYQCELYQGFFFWLFPKWSG